MLSYLTTSTTAEIICFLFAVICLSKDDSSVWRSMIIFLFITCVAEISGVYFGRKVHDNQWVYNIFIIFETGFINLMFFLIFKKNINSKPPLTVGLALFVLLYVGNLISNGFRVYSNLTYTVMSVLYVLYSLYYYYLLLKDERYINLSRSADFWWVAGTLFFYFSTTACNLFDEKLAHVMITSTETLNHFIFKSLNIILYGCWSYSFICRKWLIPTTSKVSL
jgi:hypothetical protein